jgi:hypothetical protein
MDLTGNPQNAFVGRVTQKMHLAIKRRPLLTKPGFLDERPKRNVLYSM